MPLFYVTVTEHTYTGRFYHDVVGGYRDLQHLGDPATGRGGIDVPDGLAGKPEPNPVSGPGQLRVPPGADNRLQQGHTPTRHLHRMHQAHDIRLPIAPGPNNQAYPDPVSRSPAIRG
jgi:hypothetical protein